MIFELFLGIILLAVSLLFLAFIRWEYSPFVKTIDLIPGPKKTLVVGNALQLPRESDGMYANTF